MDTLTTPSEEILYIADEPAPQRRAWTRRCVVGWGSVVKRRGQPRSRGV